MNIDWKKKLTSRKFWIALCHFIGMLIMAFGYSDATAERITALVLAGGTCIAYIIGEGLVDAKSAGSPTIVLPEAEAEAEAEDEGNE